MKWKIGRIAKTISYGVWALSLIGLTIFLVALGRGYLFDFKTGQLVGGGLILVDSQPAGAQIWLKAKRVSETTPARLSLKAGNYDVRISQAGYHDWQKRLAVLASEVTWARYPLLVPNRLATQAVARTGRVSQFVQSPDHKFIALSTRTHPKVQVLETGTTKLQTIFQPSAKQTHVRIRSLQWAPDSEHLLVGLGSGSRLSYEVVSVLKPEQRVSLHREFASTAQLAFGPRDWREIFWLSSDGLRRLNLTQRTESAVLVPDALVFEVTSDSVIYTRYARGSLRVGRLERNDQTTTLLSHLPFRAHQLAIVEYNGRQYIVLQDVKGRQLRIYRVAQVPEWVATFDNIEPSLLSVSPEDHYLLAQAGTSFASYDFELGKSYRFNVGTEPIDQISWLDQYHLLGHRGRSVVMFEFDGGNLEQITSSSDLPAFGSRDQTWLYSIGRSPTTGAQVLQVSKLKP